MNDPGFLGHSLARGHPDNNPRISCAVQSMPGRRDLNKDISKLLLFVAVWQDQALQYLYLSLALPLRMVLGLDWAKSIRVSYNHLWFNTTTAQNISSVFYQHLLGNKCILFCTHSMVWGWWYPGEDPGMGLYQQTMRCTYL